MKRIELFIGLACGLMVAVSLGVGGLRAVLNPTEDRRADFELELTAVTYVPEAYVTESDANYGAIASAIYEKSTLWKELVPPPPPPPPKPRGVVPPNLSQMLQGVEPSSSRQQIIGVGGRTLINVKTPEDVRGSWLGVGDTVRGLTIKEITNETVVFSLISNNTEYTHPLPRRSKPGVFSSPNFAQLLNGVVASIGRQRISRSGGRTRVNVKTLEDQKGSWLRVGDKVNGLTIKEITKDSVVFSFMSNNKEYTHSLPRR